VEINTTNILFIAGGAFDGLDKIIKQRQQGTGMGFNFLKQQDTSDEVVPEDLMKFGMIPEFIGRFPVTVKLNELDLESLTRVLLEPKNNLLSQMQFYFDSDNIELTFDDSSILAIAQQALSLGIGARGLKTVLEKTMTPLMYRIPEFKKRGIKRITITEAVITNNIDPDLEEHEK
jgi:ATP-dependent Clp protease ATP-binding subunit ClpX